VSGAPTVFYYGLGSFECYIAAEQIMSALPTVPEWEPVLLGAADESGGDGAAAAEPVRPPRRLEALAARAAAAGLQPLRWPAGWPPDTERAMLAATYAKQIGRGVAFSLAAFRQAFAGGRDLGEDSTLLIAGAACEMHPAAVLRALATRSVHARLTAACRRANDAGVRELPAVAIGPRVLTGPDMLRDAATALGAGERRG
jgi:2-hydroxychromene-2-carboxylate isomerase